MAPGTFLLYHRWFFIHSKYFLHYLNDLTQSRIGMDSFHQVGHGIFSPFHRQAKLIQALTDASVIARSAKFLETLHLSLITLWIHFEDRDGQWLFLGISIYPNNLANPFIDLTLIAIGSIRNLALEESLFNGRNDPTPVFNASEIIVGFLLDAVSLRLNEETAAKRIDCIRHARLLRDDLLGAQSNSHGMFRGKSQGFIKGIGMQTLRAAQDGSERL